MWVVGGRGGKRGKTRRNLADGFDEGDGFAGAWRTKDEVGKLWDAIFEDVGHGLALFEV